MSCLNILSPPIHCSTWHDEFLIKNGNFTSSIQYINGIYTYFVYEWKACVISKKNEKDVYFDIDRPFNPNHYFASESIFLIYEKSYTHDNFKLMKTEALMALKIF